MTTNIPNDTLILIDKIIKITERYSLNVANYLQWLEDNNSNDRFINRIEVETNRVRYNLHFLKPLGYYQMGFLVS